MGGLLGIGALVTGLVVVGAGLLLMSRSMQQLGRTGVFTSLYWASFRRYAGYRLRSLRPLIVTLLGIVLVGVGLTVLYLGLVSFYSGRLLTPG